MVFFVAFLVMFLRGAIVPATLFFVMQSEGPVLPYVQINAEEGGGYPKPNPPDYWPGLYTENGSVCRVYEHGHWHVRPFVSSSSVVNVNGSSRSIGFHAVAAPDAENVVDRHELVVSHNTDPYALTLNSTRYLAFDFYIDPVSRTPLNWLLMCQIFQVSSGMPPPLAVYVQENPSPDYPAADHVYLNVVARDDSWVRGEDNIIWTVAVQKGVWHRLILALQPSACTDSENGYLAVYLNKDPGEGADYMQQMNWGYTPLENDPVSGTFQVRLGVYRRKSTRAFAWFADNIRFGPAKASVE